MVERERILQSREWIKEAGGVRTHTGTMVGGHRSYSRIRGQRSPVSVPVCCPSCVVQQSIAKLHRGLLAAVSPGRGALGGHRMAGNAKMFSRQMTDGQCVMRRPVDINTISS